MLLIKFSNVNFRQSAANKERNVNLHLFFLKPFILPAFTGVRFKGSFKWKMVDMFLSPRAPIAFMSMGNLKSINKRLPFVLFHFLHGKFR